MNLSVQERLQAFRARSREYLRLGHDRLAAVRFVVDTAGELGGPALDIGTGKGLLAIELARRGLVVTTIDVDAQERELARTLAQEVGLADRISFDTADAACLAFPDRSFGCVAMMDVLHHLHDPAPVLYEMARLLVAGGVALLADFDEEGFALVSRVHRAEGREHPRTGATVDSAIEVLVAAGFDRVASARGHQHEVAVLRRT